VIELIKKKRPRLLLSEPLLLKIIFCVEPMPNLRHFSMLRWFGHPAIPPTLL
jgi:hypothetical protein